MSPIFVNRFEGPKTVKIVNNANIANNINETLVISLTHALNYTSYLCLKLLVGSVF
jgi:hypothetical protein